MTLLLRLVASSRRPLAATLLLASLLLAAAAIPAHAAWSPNGTPVCVNANSQVSPVAIADGAGGAFVVWEDGRNGTTDIYCQHLTRAGVPTPGWDPAGVAVCTAPAIQNGPRLCTDGAGGIVVAWADQTAGIAQADIFANHIDTSGHIAAGWPAATSRGVAVCTAINRQQTVRMVEDGAGGAYVAWNDNRNSTSTADVVIQHVLGSGVVDPAWPLDGVDPFEDDLDESGPALLTDGAGGCWIAWTDARLMFQQFAHGQDVYFTRLTSAGAPAAGHVLDGIPAVNAQASQSQSAVCSDGAGGVFILWRDMRSNVSLDVYATRIDGNGSLHAGWPTVTASRPLCLAAGDQDQVAAVSDGSNGAFALWRDARAAATRIYANHVNGSAGLVAGWPADGLPLCTSTAAQAQHVAVSDGAGGVLAAWRDTRGADGDLYAMRIQGDGTAAPGWPAAGLAVCAVTGDVQSPSIVSDGAGGGIVFWQDARADGGDIYAAHITAAGNPAPTAGVAPVAPRFAFARRSAEPASGTESFALQLPVAATASVRVIDVSGRAVRTLLADAALEAGDHAIAWDGRDAGGAPVAPGVYLLVARAGRDVATARCVRLR